MNTQPINGSNSLVSSVVEILDQGEMLLTEINDESYTFKLPAAFNASIGGHYRHCLDHFRSLLEAVPSGDLNYDHRERDTVIEDDRFAALNATRELREGWLQMAHSNLGRALNVTCKTSYATDGSQSATSTAGREIMYVVAHAVHHYALIGIMAALMNLKLPAGFGVAPSTLKHQERMARAGWTSSN
jgi:hypothetical protein